MLCTPRPAPPAPPPPPAEAGAQGSTSRRPADCEIPGGFRPKCLEGSWGAEFPAALSPVADESVFTKRACFDAFLSDGFEQHLVRGGTGHLVFAGLFADVCVDSTARTAFQKGFHVTVLEDCTTGLHLPNETILRFMSRVYGARVTTHDQVAAWSQSPAQEDTWPAPSR